MHRVSTAAQIFLKIQRSSNQVAMIRSIQYVLPKMREEAQYCSSFVWQSMHEIDRPSMDMHKDCV